MWSWLFVGVASGVLLAVPVAVLWTRRTARRVAELERAHRASERLAELGTMTGGLAHEIKNPLSTVGLNVQLIQEDVADAEKALAALPGGAALTGSLERVSRRLEGLNRETARLRQILDDFLRFAGRIKLDRADCDINTVVEELADFFAPQAEAAGVRLRVDCRASPGVLHADAGLLKQAMLNLTLNATQALERGRKQAPGATEAPPGEVILATARDGDTVRVTVTDTGPGMPPEVRDRIFEPYFSGRRGGSGLGLPTTRRIVEEHGGGITVMSEPGRGTRFTLELPAG